MHKICIVDFRVKARLFGLLTTVSNYHNHSVFAVPKINTKDFDQFCAKAQAKTCTQLLKASLAMKWKS